MDGQSRGTGACAIGRGGRRGLVETPMTTSEPAPCVPPSTAVPFTAEPTSAERSSAETITAVRSAADPSAAGSPAAGAQDAEDPRLLRERGLATAEYAIVTVAAAGFAGLLIAILRSGEVRDLLTGVIRSALSL